MTPIIILFALSAVLLGIAIWYWKMPEKRWLKGMKADGNLYGIDYSKFHPQKIRSATITLLLFEAVCFFSMGLCSIWLTINEHPVLIGIFMGSIMGAPIVYWFVLLVFYKKSKYKKH